MVVPEPCFALAPKGEVRASPRGGGWPPAPSRSSRDECAEPRYICQTEGSCHARVADVSAVQRDCTHQVNAHFSCAHGPALRLAGLLRYSVASTVLALETPWPVRF